MSAAPLTAAALRTYRGDPGYFRGEGYEQEYRIREEQIIKSITKDTMAAEIVGLSITGILSIVGLCVSLAINYTLLSLLFVMPLVGVAIGAAYILYMKKHE